MAASPVPLQIKPTPILARPPTRIIGNLGGKTVGRMIDGVLNAPPLMSPTETEDAAGAVKRAVKSGDLAALFRMRLRD